MEYPIFIADFCREATFPEEAVTTLLSGYTALCDGELGRLTAAYDADEPIDHPAALAAVHADAEKCGVDWRTAELLLYVCFMRRLHERYREAGIGEEIFAGVTTDLRCKLFECHRLFGVWGSFVAAWFCRFFDMTRFALGRLQYEPDIYDGETYGSLKKGDPVLNVHIPSAGPLYPEAVGQSLAWAKSFFADHFGEKPFTCICHSWLLHPDIATMLPENSRIVQFQRRFEIVRVDPDPDFGDAWRLFQCRYDGDAAKLPRDTAFRRGYADYLARGGVAAEGFGIIRSKNHGEF